MIYLYSGTPGSGKSLHMARMIFLLLKHSDCLVIGNFYIKKQYFTEDQYSRFIFVPNDQMNPKRLINIATEFWKTHKAKNYRDAEQKIRLFIDEAQILFNARDWQKNSVLGWPTFFSVHRHYGFEIVLCTQMDTNLDKQVRGVIETQVIHRKLENIGISGKIINLLMGGGMFFAVVRWYPMNEKVDGYFFKYRKKYSDVYDTHALFANDGELKSIINIG